jgi:hypothetical protein
MNPAGTLLFIVKFECKVSDGELASIMQQDKVTDFERLIPYSLALIEVGFISFAAPLQLRCCPGLAQNSFHPVASFSIIARPSTLPFKLSRANTTCRKSFF